MAREQWRAVLGYESWYEVSDLGRVKRVRGGGPNAIVGRILKPDYSSRYARVVLIRDRHRFRQSVHVLVAEAFIGPRPEGHEANHENGRKRDNRGSNLEWVTSTENNRHRCRTLGHNVGTKNPASKLTPRRVRALHRLHEDGLTNISELSRRFEVSRPAVRAAIDRRTWAQVH